MSRGSTPYYSSYPSGGGGDWNGPGRGGANQAAYLGQLENSRKMASDAQTGMRGNLSNSAPGQWALDRPGAQQGQSRMVPMSQTRPMAAGSQGVNPNTLYNQVSTGITQEDLYPQFATQRASNRAFGQGMLQADALQAQKPFMGRGLSLDQGTLAAATPQIAGGTSQALQARYQLPLQDQLANQAYNLQGQEMQGNQFMGLANLLRRQQDNQFAQQQNAFGPLLQTALGGF